MDPDAKRPSPKTGGPERRKLSPDVEAQALFALLGGRVFGVEQRADGKYPGVPKRITVERFAQHLRGDGAPIAIACGPWDSTTGRMLVIDVDDLFPERYAIIADVLRDEGFRDAALFTEGSAAWKGKVAIFFAREHRRDNLSALARRIIDLAAERPGWVGGFAKIEYRPFRADVRPGVIRLLGRNLFRGGPLERSFSVDFARKGLSQVVPTDMALPDAPARPKPDASGRREPQPIPKAPLHRTVEDARRHGLGDEMCGHRELRAFLLHIAREALRLYGDATQGQAAFLQWCGEIKAQTAWATPEFRSPTTRTKGDPLKERVLHGTWDAVLRWGTLSGTSLSSGGQHTSDHDVPDRRTAESGDHDGPPGRAAGPDDHDVPDKRGTGRGDYGGPQGSTAARGGQRARRKPFADRMQVVLEAIRNIALAKGLDPMASGMSYREIARATGLPVRATWQCVQDLECEGNVVLHDRGLDYGYTVSDDESPDGVRVGLRMVVGIVPPGMRPAEVLEIGKQRVLVRRQKARVAATEAGLSRERLINESQNVARLDEHRRDAAFVRRAAGASTPAEKARDKFPALRPLSAPSAPAIVTGLRAFDAVGSLDARAPEDTALPPPPAAQCFACHRTEAWFDEIGKVTKCGHCHPPPSKSKSAIGVSKTSTLQC